MEPICTLNDLRIWYQSEIDIAFRKGNKPCYFVYASDVQEAINKAVNASRIARLDQSMLLVNKDDTLSF